ncbi:hypothetical protein VTK26DRAFT_331 [Humicola hyalothermophila]
MGNKTSSKSMKLLSNPFQPIPNLSIPIFCPLVSDPSISGATLEEQEFTIFVKQLTFTLPIITPQIQNKPISLVRSCKLRAPRNSWDHLPTAVRAQITEKQAYYVSDVPKDASVECAGCRQRSGGPPAWKGKSRSTAAPCSTLHGKADKAGPEPAEPEERRESLHRRFP